MAERVRVEVEGLKEFFKDMGVMEENFKQAEEVYSRLAAQRLVTDIKSKARRVGAQQSRASDTVKTFRASTVQYGGLPWAMGAEFGSLVHKQFPAWRGRGMGAGYFFWPAVEEFKRESMMDIWDEHVWDDIKEQFRN